MVSREKEKQKRGNVNNIKREDSRSVGETKKGEGKEIFGEGKRFAERRTGIEGPCGPEEEV